MKRHLNISVDEEVWLQCRIRNFNISAECNNYLKNRLNIQETDTEESILLRQIEDTKLQKKNIDEKLSQLQAEHLSITSEKKQEYEEALKEALFVQDSLRHNNPIRDVRNIQARKRKRRKNR